MGISAVQLREEKKLFPKKYLAEVLNMSTSSLTRQIESGRVSRATGENKQYLREDLEKIFKELNIMPKVKLHGKARAYFEETKASKLKVIGKGIFLVSPLAKHSETRLRQLIQRYDLWSAQGLNNHIDMAQCIKNPILQLMLADEIVESWIQQLRRIASRGWAIVYLNGRVDSTICIYLMSRMNREFLERYDNFLGIKECYIREFTLR